MISAYLVILSLFLVPVIALMLFLTFGLKKSHVRVSKILTVVALIMIVGGIFQSLYYGIAKPTNLALYILLTIIFILAQKRNNRIN
ncbi:hypothetical protein SY83_01520 [Paenibacillus swuensis]|uniref:Uncharacterized protein n=1 Tax=Paenibacillus swuensis TaxID=1178515 RepID=A0A172TDV5_9BACL|nr:hypothetical protein [Paenibacillus swuensis]ANE45225.1 hypothetical protein SY83_01520 [Paenibacillus swuensis]